MGFVNVNINVRKYWPITNSESLIKLFGREDGSQITYKSVSKCDKCGIVQAGGLQAGEELRLTEGMRLNIFKC